MAKKIDYSAMYTLRKDGRYQGYYYDADGRRKFVYDRDPERLYWKIKEKEQPKAPTFDDLAEAWHDEHWERIQDGTKACYSAQYDKAKIEQAGKDAADVTAADISKHLQKLAQKGYSAKLIKTQRTIYKLIFQYAILDDYYGRCIKANPAINVPLPTGLKSQKREAPEDDIIEKIRQKAGTAYFGTFAMTLISTGFRRGEALALTWGDIDYKNKTITCDKSVKYRSSTKIETPKTQAGVRTVPLLNDLAKLLKRPKGAKDSNFVFASTSGGALPEVSYRRKWIRYCIDMGFVDIIVEERVNKEGKKYEYYKCKPTLTAHVMRHGYATMLFEADVDVYTAQRLLGHSDIKTTLAIYTHLREKKQQKSLDKLNQYVSNNYQPMMSMVMSDNDTPLENT